MARRDPEVIRLANQFRRALQQRELAQMQAMTGRWLAMESQLDALFSTLAFEASQVEDFTLAKLRRMERYQALLQQVRFQLDGYHRYTADLVTQNQQININLALQQAAALIGTVPGVTGTFSLLPVNAVEFQAGFAADGTPLYNLLDQAYGDIVAGITQELVSGVGLGRNPVAVARNMRDFFGADFDRALLIARTEQLRAYRAATLDQYRSAGIVTGYRRVAAKSIRTCMACLIADGQFYPLDVPFEEHPNGRCTAVPVIAGTQELTWYTGKEWFIDQPPVIQSQMMGAKKFQAWQDGRFELDEIVKRVENDTWGNSLVPRSLKDWVWFNFLQE